MDEKYLHATGGSSVSRSHWEVHWALFHYSVFYFKSRDDVGYKQEQEYLVKDYSSLRTNGDPTPRFLNNQFA